MGEPPITPTTHIHVRPIASAVAILIAVILGLWFFDPLSTVMLGLLAAGIVASTLDPLVHFIPAPRPIAAAILGVSFIVVVAALLLALSWPLATPIERAIHDWPDTRDKIDDLLANWQERLTGASVTDRSTTMPAVVVPSSDIPQPRQALVIAPQPSSQLTVENLLGSIGRFFAGDSGTKLLGQGRDAILAVLIWLAFIFVGSIFMLADPHDRLLTPTLRVIAPVQRARVQAMLTSLAPKLRRWVIGTGISMLIVFTASGIGYGIIGLKLALPLALLAGICEIVPTVGPAVSAIVATLFAATVSGGAVVGVLIVYVIIQAIEAYVILPVIMRGALKIHPAVTLFSVVLWGKIFGVPGLMLAIPINVTIASAIEWLYVRPRDHLLPAAANETAGLS